MKRIATLSSILALVILTGCETLANFAAPQSFNQKMIVGYSTVTGLRETNIALLDAKVIDADDGQNIANANNAARAGLDIARKLEKSGDKTAAESKLDAMRIMLKAMQDYLLTRSK